MGLRCLLGHDFGEPETERERNEEGNEVVVTVREVKTCRRCGEKQVVSENKEIKSIDQLRESANVGTTEQAAGDTAASEPSVSTGTDDWSTDDSADTGFDEEPSTGGSAGPDQWTAEELMGSDETAETEPEGTVAEDDDAVEKGVAEIIESAEKDDEMLQADDEPSAEETEEEETPVHPGQRAPDEDEEPDTSEDDAVILDDESPPEEGREQWDEEADPAEVPGRDPIDSEPSAPDGEDAVIMGDDETPAEEPETAEPDAPEPSDQSEPQQADDGPTAVEDEDAVIMGSDDEPEPTQAEPTEAADGRDEEPTAVDDDAVIMDESESGHAPWPETPGEDEGHDATEPDGEPADVEFGGGITPDQAENEQNGSQSSATQPSGGSETGSAEPSAGGENAPQPNINLEQSSREAKLEYYCSECGLTREVGNSSMRAGDICPDCRKGYITERQKTE